MFEFHGWATVVYSPENDDNDDDTRFQDTAFAKLQVYLQHLAWHSNPVAEICWMNGQPHLWTTGFKNHAAGIEDGALDLFRYIAQIAPGSYGLLYTFDDEDPDHDNVFRAYVLARGAVTEHLDPFLSPRVPVIEDPL